MGLVTASAVESGTASDGVSVESHMRWCTGLHMGRKERTDLITFSLCHCRSLH